MSPLYRGLDSRIHPPLAITYLAAARFALVRYGGGVVQMSGSIAGNTFARNRFGNYARARTTPVNPASARQVKVRAILAELTERWYSTVTSAQRTQWETYAAAVAMKNRLGETVYLTGFNQYIRGNTWRLDLGQSIVDAGPVQLTLPAQDPTFAVAASEGTSLIEITFDDGMDWCTENNAGIVLLQGRPQNVTRNFFKGPYRGRSAKMGADPGGIASPQTFAEIFDLVEGQKTWVQARILRADGRISEPFEAFCTIAA